MASFKQLMAQPTQLQVTVRHHRYIYRAYCHFSDIYLPYDLHVPLDFRAKSQPSGHLMRPFVGKSQPRVANEESLPGLDLHGGGSVDYFETKLRLGRIQLEPHH